MRTKIEIGKLEFEAELEGQDYGKLESKLKAPLIKVMNVAELVEFEGDVPPIPRINEMIYILAAANKSPNVGTYDIKQAIEHEVGENGIETYFDIFQLVTEVLGNSGFFGGNRKKADNVISIAQEEVEAELLL
jgi:hypothetical protein